MRRTLLTMLMTTHATIALATGSSQGHGFACNMRALTSEERTRHAALAGELFAAILERKELSNGYAFRLPAERWLDAATWAELERKCCPFFSFELNAGADRGPMWLTITGRSGAKTFMKDEYGL